MAGRAAWDGAGRVRFDPAARRRVRRAGARARPWLLPAALVLTGLLLAPVGAPQPSPAPARWSPAVPDGLVLVAVRPSDPSVLPLAPPGSRVDVYAAAGAGALGLPGEAPAGADLLVRGAVVAGTTSGTSPPGAPAGPSPGTGGAGGGPGVLALTGTGGAAGSVPLLVTDAEAAALASRPGGPFLLAVRGGAATGGRDEG